MSTFHRVLSTFRNIALILTASGLVHAQVPVSQLPQATLPLTGNESVVMNQNGATKQAKTSSIASLVSLSAATGITLTPNPIVGGAGTIGLTLPVLASWGGTGELGVITGIPKANGTSAFTTASSSDVPIPGANTQVLFNNSGVLGANSNFTYLTGSDVLNLGTSLVPGTFSIGQLDSMVVNGVTIPVPGFALNSNTQGIFENHSYVNGVAAGGARYYGVRSEGTISSPLIVANGDHLSTWYAAGYNGTNYSLGASIMALVNGTPGATAMPTDLDFAVSPAGSQVPTSRLTLKTDGSYAVSGSVGTNGQVLTSAGPGSPASWATPSVTGLANPTATIGLTAVNGAATTAMRSDAAPALSQAISPTWTGTHGFNGTYVTSSATSLTSPGQNGITFVNSGSGANAKIWDILQSTANHLTFRAVNDAFGSAGNWLDVTRSGLALTNLTYGNNTDNPTYTFAGSGAETFNGPATFQATAATNVTIVNNGSTNPMAVTGIAGRSALAEFAANGNSAGSTSMAIGQDSTGVNHVLGRNSATLLIGTGNTNWFTLDTNGHLTMAAPSAGGQTSYTFNARNGNNAMLITQQAGAGTAFGVVVQAGTTSADYSLSLQSQAGSQLFEVFGDGGVTTGANTDQGAGTINATQYYRAALPMFPVIGVVSCGGGGCTALRATGMSGVVARAGPGQYTVTFNTAFAGQNVCFVTVQGTTAAYGVANPVAGSTTVNTFNSAGTLTDTIWGLTCT